MATQLYSCHIPNLLVDSCCSMPFWILMMWLQFYFPNINKFLLYVPVTNWSSRQTAFFSKNNSVSKAVNWNCSNLNPLSFKKKLYTARFSSLDFSWTFLSKQKCLYSLCLKCEVYLVTELITCAYRYLNYTSGGL